MNTANHCIREYIFVFATLYSRYESYSSLGVFVPALVIILHYGLVPRFHVFCWILPPTAFCLATPLYDFQITNALLRRESTIQLICCVTRGGREGEREGGREGGRGGEGMEGGREGGRGGRLGMEGGWRGREGGRGGREEGEGGWGGRGWRMRAAGREG